MEFGETVDDHLGELPVGALILAAAEFRGNRATDHDAATPLHHEEGGADHVHVVAVEIGARSQGKSLPQHREGAVLPMHVVGAGRHRPQRRPPEHVLDAALSFAVLEQVGEIGVAPGELLDAQRKLSTLELVTQIGVQGRLVEALVGANRNQLGSKGAAMARRNPTKS